MDKETRDHIQRAAQDARTLLEREFSGQLEGVFDIHLDGTIAATPGSHLDTGQRVLRTKLIAAVAHLSAGGLRKADAVAGYLREAAFTTLNRFVALKMLEARELVQECISRADQSAGFKEFAGLAPGLVQLPDHGYRLYVESLFDEIGREVGILFDRRDPASLLWPRRQALLDLLTILNDPEKAEVWQEDETIGWIYQYFNSDEERKQMRAQSQAPRNGRELAVRNQFFTPRYVVEFLTDNTLGRIWYEMQHGETRLVERCSYLVRRASEVFLANGEKAPDEDAAQEENLSQEDLFAKTAYISFRSRKDPRDIKLLDPACGSAHFLIYGFDLLIIIYEEAWAGKYSQVSEVTGCTLQHDYPDIELLRRALPGLILQHNLHGIEIDPRAAQIAALALWMKAQRAYKAFGLDRANRPAIAKTNIVVAEPMPGERELQQEFIASLDKRLGKLVERVFEKMEFAGEAGSLLKVDDEIQSAIRDIYGETGELFRKSDEDRWQEAEHELLGALQAYAEQAQNGSAYRRRLFADDAARGFAFIDLSRQRYDVVLMNPPFGDPTRIGGDTSGPELALAANDIGGAFVAAAQQRWAPSGCVGILGSATLWFKPTVAKWRESVVLTEDYGLKTAAHLGGQVLDGAKVSVAATVLVHGPEELPSIFIRSLVPDDREHRLLQAVQKIRACPAEANAYAVYLRELRAYRGAPIVYWISRKLRRNLLSFPPLEGTAAEVRQGIATADDPRFVRAWWEIAPDNTGLNSDWAPLGKSSEYSPFWDDIPWLLNWRDGGREVRAFERAYPRSTHYYGRSGVTYPARSYLGFNPRAFPPDCAFSHMGSVAFPLGVSAAALLGYLSSRPLEYVLSFSTGSLQGDLKAFPNHYEVGQIKDLPWPTFTADALDELARWGEAIATSAMELQEADETTHQYAGRPTLCRRTSIADEVTSEFLKRKTLVAQTQAARKELDRLVGAALGFEPSDIDEMEAEFQACVAPGSGPWSPGYPDAGDSTIESEVTALVSEIFGFTIGRFDVRYALDVTQRPDKRGALDPLPSAPLALLERLPQAYPIPIPEDGILVDDEGHQRDIAALVRNTLGVIWRDKAPEIEHELMRLLSVPDLGGYFRGSGGTAFFSDHLGRYTRSRRKAPIYWQLGTPSSSYSVWLYYHRSTRDLFYKVASDYVVPKWQHEERKLSGLVQSSGASPTASQRKAIDAQARFVEELRVMLEEVKRIAPLWHPDLNDGVLLTMAPLWRLVPQHKAWQKELKATWDALCAEQYDWAHLAMHLWPERVVPKCAKDRSLAIAHGLEDVFWIEGSDGKWQPRQVDRATIETLIKERTSLAVKDALESLLHAPAPGNGRAKNSRTSANAKRVRHDRNHVVGERHA